MPESTLPPVYITKYSFTDDDYCSREKLVVKYKDAVLRSWSVQDLTDCPEDAILGRDLMSMCEVADAIKFGMQIAKDGNEVIWDSIEVKSWDEWEELGL